MIGPQRGRPLLAMALIAVALLSLRGLGGPGPLPPGPVDPLDRYRPVPGGPGADFAPPPQTRRIRLADGAELDEGVVAEVLRREGLQQRWSAFTWWRANENVATVAPGLDGRHHFANAYLVGYVPYAGVEPWVPLASLARNKRYRYDHEQYPGIPELWQTSREAFHFPEGDCEDHAIALADWLIGLGLEARVVIGRARGEGHAWVVLLQGGRTYLLEATHKRPGRALPLAVQFPDYHPEVMFDREHYWVNTGSPATTDYTGLRWQLRSRFSRG